MFKITRCIIALLIVGISVPADPYLADATQHPEALIVYLYAKDVHFSKNGPTDQVSYHVGGKFSPAEVVDWISQKLNEARWRPLANDFLNPGLPASQMRTWHEGLAGLKEPGICVNQWIGYWRDSTGNIVRYAFRYKEPCATHASKDLEVFAAYFPEDAVREMSKAFEQGHTLK